MVGKGGGPHPQEPQKGVQQHYHLYYAFDWFTVLAHPVLPEPGRLGTAISDICADAVK